MPFIIFMTFTTSIIVPVKLWELDDIFDWLNDNITWIHVVHDSLGCLWINVGINHATRCLGNCTVHCRCACFAAYSVSIMSKQEQEWLT